MSLRSEHAWIARLGAVIGPTAGAVRVGIGDDAAVLRPEGGGDLVVTVDASVEGVHFTRAIASLEDIGFRSFMAAASDLGAMAARPLAALSALTLPADLSDEDLDRLVDGQRQAASLTGIPVVGGNLARGSDLSVTTTVLGTCARPVLRSGARPGDRLWLAGPVGLAAAGLRLLLGGHLVAGDASLACVAAWRRPRARLAAGLAAAGRASAMVDISDGLAQDAGHLARASSARLVLDADAVVALSGDSLQTTATLLGADPFALALAGGEDYALLAASPDDLHDAGFAPVGRVEAGEAAVVVLRAGRAWVPPAGFDHGG